MCFIEFVFFSQTLKEANIEPDFPFEEIAKQTDGLSGSDLKEICRTAVMGPVQEYMASMKGNLSSLENKTKEVLFSHFVLPTFSLYVV